MLSVCVVILTANFVDTGKATFGALGEVNLEPGESLLYQVQQVLHAWTVFPIGLRKRKRQNPLKQSSPLNYAKTKSPTQIKLVMPKPYLPSFCKLYECVDGEKPDQNSEPKPKESSLSPGSVRMDREANAREAGAPKIKDQK